MHSGVSTPEYPQYTFNLFIYPEIFLNPEHRCIFFILKILKILKILIQTISARYALHSGVSTPEYPQYTFNLFIYPEIFLNPEHRCIFFILKILKILKILIQTISQMIDEKMNQWHTLKNQLSQVLESIIEEQFDE